jgi:hypothetical protein
MMEKAVMPMIPTPTPAMNLEMPKSLSARHDA